MANNKIDKPKPEGYRFGRPPKYTPELLNDCWDYIYGEIDEQGNPTADAKPKWQELGHPTPSIVGLCCCIGIVTSTAHEWRKHTEKKDFSDILEIIDDLQHLYLINNGTTGAFNSTITKLRLTKHGYADTADVKNEYVGGKHIIYIEKEDKSVMEDHIASIVDDIDANQTS